MATTLSRKNFFERQDVATLRSDQPMDAGYVWTLLDNINHLVDESGKYRVNWMSRNGGDAFFGADEHAMPFSADSGYWYTIFPTQPVNGYQYPRYDIRIGIATGIDASLRVSLVTPGTTPPILADDQPGVIGSFTADLTTSFPDITYGWVEGLLPSRSNRDANFQILPTPSFSDSDFSFGPLVLVKLIVEVLSGNEEGGPVIIGAQVREYLR